MNEAQYYECQRRKIRNCDACKERFKCWTSKTSEYQEIGEALAKLAGEMSESMLTLDDCNRIIKELQKELLNERTREI